MSILVPLPSFFFNWIVSYCYWVVWVFYVFWILTTYPIYDFPQFSPILQVAFLLVTCFFCCIEAFKFNIVLFVEFCFCYLCFWCCIQNSLPKPVLRSSSLGVVLGVSWYQILCLIFNPFWVNFCEWYKIRIQFHCSSWVYPVFLIPFVEEPVLSPLGVLGSLVEC